MLTHSPKTLGSKAGTILSYLCGLAPVGASFSVNYRHMLADIHVDQMNGIQHIRRLVAKGALEIVTHGHGSDCHVLRVAKRPEEFEVEDFERRQNGQFL